MLHTVKDHVPVAFKNVQGTILPPLFWVVSTPPNIVWLTAFARAYWL